MHKQKTAAQSVPRFKPRIGYRDAGKRADSILRKMSRAEKIQLIGGDRSFFIKGFRKYDIPGLYLSDATQGIHIREQHSRRLGKSVAFPCPIALAATWNPGLAERYARSIGEECRAGGIAVLLGPGVNMYRLSTNGRSFEYFSEDPFLNARLVEKYVVGLQSTGTIATLKHFLCNNNEYYRRTTNVIADERTLHEIYLPAFKAGIDAGAMAVMTSYNLVNGEWTGQSGYVISNLLRKQLGFKWLVMTDWWSTWDPVKTIRSGQDLEMPGHPMDKSLTGLDVEDFTVKSNAARLIMEGKVAENDINRMAKDILRTCIAMGLHDRPARDKKYLKNFPAHEEAALQTAREAVVLLKNENNILPINPKSVKKILLTGDYAVTLARGLGSARVDGYDSVSLLDALKKEFGAKLRFVKNPSEKQIRGADVVIVSIGTEDRESIDKAFEHPDLDKKVLDVASKNPRVIVVVNTGGGMHMQNWNEKVPAILYAWYPGQNGNRALAEIVAGKTNPCGKLPITIEKRFEDSPGFPYIPRGEKLIADFHEDNNMLHPVNNLEYKEGVFTGYRWYDSKGIEPLYHFGFGLSYTTFAYSRIRASGTTFKKGRDFSVSFDVLNTGTVAGSEIAQLYIREENPVVPRPAKELKGFEKLALMPGERKAVRINLDEKSFAYWDVNKRDWKINPGLFTVMAGPASHAIALTLTITVE